MGCAHRIEDEELVAVGQVLESLRRAQSATQGFVPSEPCGFHDLCRVSTQTASNGEQYIQKVPVCYVDALFVACSIHGRGNL